MTLDFKTIQLSGQEKKNHTLKKFKVFLSIICKISFLYFIPSAVLGVDTKKNIRVRCSANSYELPNLKIVFLINSYLITESCKK